MNLVFLLNFIKFILYFKYIIIFELTLKRKYVKNNSNT